MPGVHRDGDRGHTAQDDRDYLLLAAVEKLQDETRDGFRELRDQGREQGVLLARIVALHEADHAMRTEHFALQRRGLDATIAEQEKRGAWLRGLLTPQNILLALIALSMLVGNGAGAASLVRVALGLPASAPAAAVVAPVADDASSPSNEE